MKPGETPMNENHIVDQIRAARVSGMTHVAVYSHESLNSTAANPKAAADAVCAAMGLRGLGSGWLELPGADAGAALAALLHRDLAYLLEIMPLAEAKRLAGLFVALFDPNATFFSNGTLAASMAELPGFEYAEWDAVTDATFDSGIIAVDRERIGIAWFEDEDA
jgi:hypothetical protein